MYIVATVRRLLCLAATILVLGTSSRSSPGEDYYLRQWPDVQDYENQGTTPLYVGLAMSFSGDVDSSGTVPGVQVALNQINSDPYMLPGYTLHYTLTDSQVPAPDSNAPSCVDLTTTLK